MVYLYINLVICLSLCILSIFHPVKTYFYVCCINDHDDLLVHVHLSLPAWLERDIIDLSIHLFLTIISIAMINLPIGPMSPMIFLSIWSPFASFASSIYSSIHLFHVSLINMSADPMIFLSQLNSLWALYHSYSSIHLFYLLMIPICV